LNDDKKLENWDKYGNPNGPDASYYEDKYPDFITNPPKTFVLFYVFIMVLFLTLPLSFIVIPFLKSPPAWIREAVDSEISAGESLLTKHNKDSIAQFEKARKVWEDLVKTFPKWSSSAYFPYYHFKIAARIAQYKIYENDTKGAVSDLSETRKFCEKDLLKSKEVQFMIKPIIANVSDTASDCGLKKNETEAIRVALATFQK
jgi:hypothetical protein